MHIGFFMAHSIVRHHPWLPKIELDWFSCTHNSHIDIIECFTNEVLAMKAFRLFISGWRSKAVWLAPRDTPIKTNTIPYIGDAVFAARVASLCLERAATVAVVAGEKWCYRLPPEKPINWSKRTTHFIRISVKCGVCRSNMWLPLIHSLSLSFGARVLFPAHKNN